MVAAKNEKEAKLKLKEINKDAVISHQESDVLDTGFPLLYGRFLPLDGQVILNY